MEKQITFQPSLNLLRARFIEAVAPREWSRAKTVKTWLASSALAILAFIALFLIYVIVVIARERPTIPSLAEIAAFHPTEATTIYSSDGVLLAKLETGHRKVVDLKQISPNLINATIAAEDSRFYEHGALDFKGISRAALADLLQFGELYQGGS